MGSNACSAVANILTDYQWTPEIIKRNNIVDLISLMIIVIPFSMGEKIFVFE